MNCPKCFEPLRIADRKGIEIDYCPECRGVWLDRGELDKIIERTGVMESRTPEPERRRDYGDYKDGKKYSDDRYRHDHKKKHYKKKKAKHLLEELFDVFD